MPSIADDFNFLPILRTILSDLPEEKPDVPGEGAARHEPALLVMTVEDKVKDEHFLQIAGALKYAKSKLPITGMMFARGMRLWRGGARDAWALCLPLFIFQMPRPEAEVLNSIVERPLFVDEGGIPEAWSEELAKEMRGHQLLLVDDVRHRAAMFFGKDSDFYEPTPGPDITS